MHRATAFHQQIHHAPGTKVAEQGPQVHAPVFPGGQHRHFSACLFQSQYPFIGGGLRGGDERGPWLVEHHRFDWGMADTVQHNPQRLAFQGRTVIVAGGQIRVVGQRCVHAHQYGVADPAHLLHESPGLWAGDPLGVTGVGGDLAIERHGVLDGDERCAGGDLLSERLVELPGTFRLFLHNHDAGGSQFVSPFAGYIRVGVDDSVMDFGDAGSDDSFGARWGAAPGATWFQSGVEGGASGLIRGLFQGNYFGMILPWRLGGAGPDLNPVFDQHRADRGIGAGGPHNLLGQLNGPLHVAHDLGQDACGGSGFPKSWWNRLAVGTVCPWYLLPRDSEP